MTCVMCKIRGKSWKGSDSVCFFDDAQCNWNCATLSELRLRLANPVFDCCSTYSGDTVYYTVPLFEMPDNVDDVLIISWYKSRGHTEHVFTLGGDGDPRVPTEKELLSIIVNMRGVS